jgi:hypothetical protein
MIDSIGSSANLPSAKRAHTSLQTSSLRNTSILTAVQQTQQRLSNAVAPVKIFAVPQASRNGIASPTRLPRGSLVDVLA